MLKNNTPSIIRAITQFNRSEISHLFAHSQQVFKAEGIAIRMAPRSKELGRILMVISRKYGSAVQRNKLRRQLRHLFYEEKLYEKPYDWIISTYPHTQKRSYENLKQLMLNAVLNAESIKNLNNTSHEIT